LQVNLTVDCTPIEARSFFGLPDVTPLHDVYIEKMKSFAAEGIKPEEMERIFRMWTGGMNEGFDQWQKMFWQAINTGMNPAVPAKR